MPDREKTLSFETTDPPSRQCAITPEVPIEHDADASHTLTVLVRIIREHGQDPVTQLSGYLITDDPTYLPEYSHARLLADRIGRDKLLETLIRLYLEGSEHTSVSSEPRP